MIYLDYAATSPLNDEVYETYQHLLKESFANSESIYDIGYTVKKQLDKSRELIADFFSVSSQELIFTSGASEANAMAIKGYALAHKDKGKHLITTAIEHSSVLNAYKQLEEILGFEVTYLPVDNQGFIDKDELRQCLRDDTIMVSVMMVNNEIGTIQPIAEIAKIITENSKAVFHVDCVQALGKIDIDFMLFDMATFSAHKIGGLKGSGLLYKKRHLQIEPLIHGGNQEFGLRGGTSNALAHILFAKTVRLALANKEKNALRIKELKRYLVSELNKIEGVVIHSPLESSDYILSFSTMKVPSEIMLNGLVNKKIYVSARSTCHARADSNSYVLEAIQASPQAMKTVLRVSFGYETTFEEINIVLYEIKELMKFVKS